VKRQSIIAAAVVALSTVAVGSARADTAAALDWQPCGDNVQCATLQVPIDWSRGGATIGIALARRMATDPAARIGTIVSLPGGPGDSGVNQVLRGWPVTPDVAARFDVVSLDPRGTNRSSPVLCDKALVDAPPNVDPDMGARFADVRAYSQKLGDSCRKLTGDLVYHMDSGDVARDVDAVRAALGERQISLYSRSYGTLATQMYAEKFPGRVRAMVLDSVFDHSLSTQQLVESETRTVEGAFNTFADWCTRSDNCALHGQDVGAVFDELYARAGRGELYRLDDPAKKLAPFDLSFMVTREFYEPLWAQLSADLVALGEQHVTTRVAPDAEGTEFPIAIFCADHRLGFRSEQDWSRQWHRLAEIAPHMHSHFAWQAASMCAGWPLPATNPQHRPDVHVPALILNSRHDPATSIEWAVDVNRAIRQSVLVTYEGSGHGIYKRNECTMKVTDRYLIDRVLPSPGTSCPASDPA
jgi:pimeloyl-ACP methyl ester carboxylesterase